MNTFTPALLEGMDGSYYITLYCTLPATGAESIRFTYCDNFLFAYRFLFVFHESSVIP